MTLHPLIEALDDTALVTAASKGLLMRARKDVEAGRVAGTEALITAAGEDVVLSPKGLEAARCTCPATGTCRHILAAVLFLREQIPAEATPHTEAVPSSFALDDIESFAGADWPRALAQVEQGQLDMGAGTPTVRFVQTEETVSFPRGQPLRAALYKGPRESRRRRSVAAAALVVAQSAGTALPETQVACAPRADPATLQHARAAIEAAAIGLATGTLDVARARLFDCAISTRAEAIPRLAAEMRNAAKRMDPAALRRAEETPAGLLAALAHTHALTIALEHAPSDPALMGSLARSFTPSGARDLGFLGAEWWQTPSGAKGFTAHFAALDSGHHHRVVQARAAGTDLSFDPRSCWELPLWGLTAPGKIGAEQVQLPDAALAPDGGLGLNQSARWADVRVTLDALEHCGAATGDFSTLENRATAQIGIGLRARPGEAFAVLRPRKVLPPTYDPLQQKTSWMWEDASGTPCLCTLPDDTDWCDRLTPLGRRVRGGLVGLRPGRPTARLISLWLDNDGPLSLQFSSLPKQAAVVGLVDKLRERVSAVVGLQKQGTVASIDPLRLTLERALEGVLAGLVTAPGLPEKLTSDLRALGLSRLEGLNADWIKDGSVAAGLSLAHGLASGLARLREETPDSIA